jgi:hypothetical protein
LQFRFAPALTPTPISNAGLICSDLIQGAGLRHAQETPHLRQFLLQNDIDVFNKK